jgi:uncharacterized protein DUF4157
LTAGRAVVTIDPMTSGRDLKQAGRTNDLDHGPHGPGQTPGKRTRTMELDSAPDAAAPRGGGQRLPEPVQAKMSRSFGADFSGVRVHEGAHVSALGALGYTQGNDVHFAPGEYQPASPRGQELLGHELAHVVQQRQGRVQGDVQGKGGAINADPALEREADEMGARAARGEPAGASAAGPQANGPAVIQRYSVSEREGKKWRTSDDGGVMVEATGAAGYRSKDAYAPLALIAASSDKLSAAGSFIRLEPGSPRFGRAHVVPRFVGPGAEHGEVHGTPGETHGSDMLMPSDCNNSARLIMGVDHDPTINEQSPHNPEVTVGNQGRGAEVRDDRREFAIKPGGGDSNLVESGGLTQLNDSMVRYRAVIAGRPVARLDREGVELFGKRTASLTDETTTANAWGVLHALKHKHPAVYHDFTSWAGINESARPAVGDALVTYLPEGKGPDAFTTNPRAYNAMVEVLRKALGGDEPVGTSGGSREVQQRMRQRRIERARSKVMAPLREVVTTADDDLAQINHKGSADQVLIEQRRGELVLAEQRFQQVSEATYDSEDTRHEVVTAARLAIGRLTSSIAGVQRRLDNLDNERIRPREVKRMTQALLDKLADPATDATALAREALALIGIKADTTWPEARGAIMQDMRAEQLGTDANNALARTVRDTSLWNKHWGGVVMTEGGDYLTLENDASTEDHGKMNTQWGFSLYGSEQSGQSFHEQMMKTGDFGSFASTARFTGPRGQDDKQQRGATFDGNQPDPSADQQIDLALSRAEDRDHELREVLEQLGAGARLALKRRYAVRAPLPEAIRARVVELIDELAGVVKRPQVLPPMTQGGCRSEVERVGGDHDHPPPPAGEAV